jgi:ankyrin repeat protein
MAELVSVFSNAFNEDVALDTYSSLFNATHDKKWTIVLDLVKQRPYEAEIWSSRTAYDGEIVWKRLPIHEACINNAPVTVVEALLTAYPQSIAAVDLSNRLPLHHAAAHGADFEVVDLLASTCPGSLIATDIYGKIPKMCLMACGIVKSDSALYNKLDEILSKPFEGKRLITFGAENNAFDEELSFDVDSTELFLAIKNKCWEKAVKLIESDPSKVKEWTKHRDCDGDIIWKRLPIHEACINNAPVNVIEALLRAYREGSECLDLNDRLPIHHAAVHSAKLQVIEILLQAYPNSVKKKDIFQKTPVKCLKAPDHNDFSIHCAKMEALSKEPSYYNNLAATKNIAITQITREMEIKELKERLEKELDEKRELHRQLDEIHTRSKFLEEQVAQQSNENSKLRDSLTGMRSEYNRLERDVLGGTESILDEEKNELISILTTSFDRSRPLDNIVVRDKNLKTLKAEVKEREFILEKALLKARGSVSYE